MENVSNYDNPGYKDIQEIINDIVNQLKEKSKERKEN
jgi:hypothetical protein